MHLTNARRRFARSWMTGVLVVVLAATACGPDADVTVSAGDARDARPEGAEVTTDVPDSWSFITSQDLDVRIERKSYDQMTRRLRPDELRTAAIPTPGLPTAPGCRVRDSIVLTVTAPSGQTWSATYAEYEDRIVVYVDGSGAEFDETMPRFIVQLVTGLDDGSETVGGFPLPQDARAEALHGIAVIAALQPPGTTDVDPSTIKQPTVLVDGQVQEISLPVWLDWISENGDRRDKMCDVREPLPEWPTAPDDVVIDVARIAQSTMDDLLAGDFDQLALDVAIPALGDSPEQVRAVLADVRNRALVTPLGSEVRRNGVVTTTDHVWQISPDLVLAEVGLHGSVGATSVIVDFHRRDGRWRVSPQALCASLRIAQTYCIPTSEPETADRS